MICKQVIFYLLYLRITSTVHNIYSCKHFSSKHYLLKWFEFLYHLFFLWTMYSYFIIFDSIDLIYFFTGCPLTLWYHFVSRSFGWDKLIYNINMGLRWFFSVYLSVCIFNTKIHNSKATYYTLMKKNFVNLFMMATKCWGKTYNRILNKL